MFEKIIGCSTICNKSWRKEVNILSIYSFSCIGFSLVGVIAFYFNKIVMTECIFLIFQGITSLNSDVVYLGIETNWRLIDTVLAVSQISYYLNTVKNMKVGNDLLLGLMSFILSFFCFKKSQESILFIEREYWHTLWHFLIQYALMIFLFKD